MDLFGAVNNRPAAAIIHFEQSRRGKVTQNLMQFRVQLGRAVEEGTIEGELGLFTPERQHFGKRGGQQRGRRNPLALDALLQHLPVGGFHKEMAMDKFGFGGRRLRLGLTGRCPAQGQTRGRRQRIEPL